MESNKLRYSDKELAEFELIVDAKLNHAKDQLTFYNEQILALGDNTNSKANGVEEGIQSAENERLVSLANRQQKLILHLENAKLRIKNKVYGVCRVTGDLISKARLNAVPHATLSIKAKQQQR